MEQPPQGPPSEPPQVPPPSPPSPPSYPPPPPPPPQPGSPPTQVSAPQTPPAAPQAPQQWTPAKPAKKRRGWVIALVIVLILGLLSCCCVAGVVWWAAQQQAQGSADLKSSLTSFASGEQSLAGMDALASGGFSRLSQASVADASAKVNAAETALANAQTKADSAKGKLSGTKQAVAISALMAIQQDLAAVKSAKTMLPAVQAAATAAAATKAAWAAIQADRDIMNRSVTFYNKHNKAGATKALALRRQGMTKLKEAQADYAAAKRAFPQGTYGPFLSYLSLRMQMNRIRQAGAKFYAAGNVSAANGQVGRGNTIADQLNKVAAKLPSPEASYAVTSGLKKTLGAEISVYRGIRQKAASAAQGIQNQLQGTGKSGNGTQGL